MLEEQFNTDELVQKIEGQVTAELFDAKTGELVQREETHNFVSTPASAFLKQAQRTVFKQGIYTLNSALMQDYQLLDKSDACIVLTDYAAAEDAANETHMYGQPIGWSSKAVYSGTDTLRGTPNASLSQATTTYCKWVFDWPTNAANGTIASIGWSKFYVGGSVGMWNTLDTSLTNTAFTYASNSTVTQVYPSSTGTYHFLSRSSSSVCFGAVQNNTTISKLDATFAVASTFSIASQFTTGADGIAWDAGNSKLWVLGNSGATYKIASYNASGTLIDGPFTVTSAGRTLRGLAYDGQYLWMGDTAGTSCILWRINPADGTDVSSFTFPQPKYSNGGGSFEVIADMACDTTSQIVWVKLFQYDVSNNRGYMASNQLRAYSYTGQPKALSVSLFSWLATQAAYAYTVAQYSGDAAFATSSTNTYDAFGGSFTNPTGSSGYTYGFDVIDKYNFICCLPVTNINTFKIVALTADGMGSRALLGTPIAKTNTQTLRITYQMNYS